MLIYLEYFSVDNSDKYLYDLSVKNKAIFALLFGSYARGTATEHSDLDIIFVEETNKPFLSRLDPYFSPLSDLMNGGVDVFVYMPDEFKKIVMPRVFINLWLKGI